ncbi:hypothetical protein [Nesterenkonia sphaerica]|uniref:Uncharacterized protein n=1 Tax=Nesterenkonia sphaerica TaxID=1804988 RepID=A0A5R9AG97_9MICC|nr:hypothetical protein [Nesterenkonia sphaerica]TLP76907.1 hypothetical protein FEF27_06605 [Nesterenkonia sphaerica]
MATTDNKLRSIAAILGIGSLALVGVSACDDGAAEDTEDPGVEENGDEGLEEEDDGLEDDGMEEEDEEGDL